MALAPGTKLGPYEIQSPLGAGGMGEVYRARDTRLERDVAIKVLPANLYSDLSLRQRLEREAKAVSRLSHPHICTLHDIGRQDGVDFLVMELFEGETLEHKLIKGPLPTVERVSFRHPGRSLGSALLAPRNGCAPAARVVAFRLDKAKPRVQRAHRTKLRSQESGG
jgi:serine/threonine protein kinase